MEQNPKNPKHLAKVGDKPRFAASLGYERDFEAAYAEVIGSMMQAVLNQIHQYVSVTTGTNNVTAANKQLHGPHISQRTRF